MSRWSVVAICLLGWATSADAQLSVTPGRTVLRARPGQARTGSFLVSNLSDQVMRVSVEPEDWSGGATGGRGNVSWMKVRPKRLKLKPGRTAKVRYKVRVPKDATGELSIQVFFTTEQEGAPGQMAVRSRLGTIVYLAVEGTEEVGAEVLRVKSFYTAPEGGPRDRLEITLDIANRGNVHVVPAGDVRVVDGEGRTRYRMPIRSGWGLLPREQDTYRAIRRGVRLEPGAYTLQITVRCGEDLGQPVRVELEELLVITEPEPALPSYHSTGQKISARDGD